jgi:uncharacterized protein (TIGR00290 family)
MTVAAMLWTGGKDSSLALHEAARAGYRIERLVTFAPPEPRFLAHPLALLALQAEAIGLPHQIVTIRAPFAEGYEAALRALRDEGIAAVITGDIARVGGSPNWIRERCRPVGMEVHTPLWGRDRAAVLETLIRERFAVRFSCVATRWLDPSWVGRVLDERAIAELREVRARTGLDLCGEEGEYHTLVTDGPPFARAIELRAFATRVIDGLAHIEIREMALR